MIWHNNKYQSIRCSSLDVNQLPIDPIRMVNFEKIEVSMATDFFDEKTKKPKIWYSKSKSGAIEYFTAPGLHPITGKTLQAISEYIIDKYVPLHTSKQSSFVE